jgi:hypothetical protein
VIAEAGIPNADEELINKDDEEEGGEEAAFLYPV